MQAIQIRINSTQPWHSINGVLSLSDKQNVLDGDGTGRNNNTGKMFFDTIASKKTYTFGVGQTTNTECKQILDIIANSNRTFDCRYPDNYTGVMTNKRFYCDPPEIEIAYVKSETEWVNNPFEVELIEQ